MMSSCEYFFLEAAAAEMLLIVLKLDAELELLLPLLEELLVVEELLPLLVLVPDEMELALDMRFC